MSITEYALTPSQERTLKPRSSGRIGLSMSLFMASAAATTLALLIGH